MLRSAAGKVMWVGRATVFLVGLAVVLALLFGVASTAMSATGETFILGKENTAGQVSKLINEGAGAALRLEVQDGQPPLRVNSSSKVHHLNSDLLDGKNSTEFYAAGSQVADSLHADSADSATNATNAQTADHATTADTATNADNATTAENADLLDNKDSTDFAAAYKSTVVVSPVGTDAENGTALINTLNGLADDASATKPYLLHIEPATYDLGNSTLTMQPWVDIEGSGELNTVIRSVVGNCDGTVRGTSNAELRFLTVLNTSTQTCGAAIFSLLHSPQLTHVTAEATGAGTNKMGVYNSRSNATMTDVTATASGGSGNNYGVYNDLSSPTIRQSKLSGTTSSLYQTGISSNTKVALTQLVGPVTRQEGTLQCFNNYDENLAVVTCP